MGAFDGCFPNARRPSPYLRRVGPHNCTFEACSGFTRVAAYKVASPPKSGPLSPGLQQDRQLALPEPTARVAKEVYHQFLLQDSHLLVDCALVAH
jgi:hypothetical protein